jgi:hypothetical protein
MAGGDWSEGDGGGGDWGGSPEASSGGDSYSETSSEGWLSRIGKALVGIPIGILLFLGSIVVLFWNEGRSVRTAKDLAEGKSAVVSVEPARVDPALEGKLVHTSGEATTAETLKDPLFGISASAIRLQRVVQMYQWQEKSETRTRKKLGGGEERTTTYTYHKDWADKPIPSSRFKKSGDHHNPENWPFQNWSAQAGAVALGAFRLPANLIGQIGGHEPLPVGEPERDALPDDVKAQLTLDSGRFYRGDAPAHPEVGDMTVEFRVVRPKVVSLIAQQAGDSFRPYPTYTGGTFERLQVGTASAGKMFASAESENGMLTWILRLVGFVVMAVGIGMVLSPLSVLADVLPFLGDLLGMGTAFVAVALAATFSLVTIALGWIAYRPVLGVGLLVLAGAVLAGSISLRRGRRRESIPRAA